jgi:hypothetical protein
MTPQSLSQYIHPGWGEDPQLLSSPLSRTHSIYGRRRPLDGDTVICCAATQVERVRLIWLPYSSLSTSSLREFPADSCSLDIQELLVFCCLAMGAGSVTLQPDLSSLDPDSDQADLYILPDYAAVPAQLEGKHRTFKVVDIEWVKQTIIFGEKVSPGLLHLFCARPFSEC